DENISDEAAVALLGREAFERVREVSLGLFRAAGAYALERGIIIADTKFEFGVVDGQIVLIDEVLTPDSSRFWLKAEYEPGHGQPSFDKQYLRDWLSAQSWDKTPPPPALPAEVVRVTAEKYRDAYRILTGGDL
ncbi:MAG: phosphoribosylaminoimidazolesuccinocarboxamide synthase, partial [Deltaproteobacteria bacterium]|nr:phosphoribosylaminoimidazolesuccinocarboxamide synthase [Deltaproteobacteria bacterium]